MALNSQKRRFLTRAGAWRGAGRFDALLADPPYGTRESRQLHGAAQAGLGLRLGPTGNSQVPRGASFTIQQRELCHSTHEFGATMCSRAVTQHEIRKI
jgi:hypothetical protein